jgi:hypothetical protein
MNNLYYKNFLNKVNKEHVFITENKEIKNISELLEHLKSEKKIFDLHVTPEKNDFAKWIKEVVKDYKLAETLYLSKDYDQTIDIIEERIKFLELVKEFVFENISIMSLNGDLSSDRYFNMLNSKEIFTNFLNINYHKFENEFDEQSVFSYLSSGNQKEKKGLLDNENILEFLKEQYPLSNYSKEYNINLEIFDYPEKKDIFSNFSIKEIPNKIKTKFSDFLYKIQKRQ